MEERENHRLRVPDETVKLICDQITHSEDRSAALLIMEQLQDNHRVTSGIYTAIDSLGDRFQVVENVLGSVNLRLDGHEGRIQRIETVDVARDIAAIENEQRLAKLEAWRDEKSAGAAGRVGMWRWVIGTILGSSLLSAAWQQFERWAGWVRTHSH